MARVVLDHCYFTEHGRPHVVATLGAAEADSWTRLDDRGLVASPSHDGGPEPSAAGTAHVAGCADMFLASGTVSGLPP